MDDVLVHYAKYKENAKKARFVMREESKIMHANLKTVFYEASLDNDYFKMTPMEWNAKWPWMKFPDEYAEWRFPEKFMLPVREPKPTE
jgi:hypothetical protein